MALSATSLEEVIKPEMQQRFRMEKKNWFPSDDTPEQEDAWFSACTFRLG
jgi:hypothetical protein